MARRTLVHIALVVAFIIAIAILVIVDQTSGDKIRADSASIYQGDSGPGYYAALILTEGGIAWIMPVLYLFYVFHHDTSFMVYILFMYFFGQIVVFTTKAFYYRGRPWCMIEQIKACACDPAMPSGHSTSAASAFIILYQLISRYYINPISNSSKRRLLKAAHSILCTCLLAVVLVSVVMNGIHDYSQVLFGAAIAGLVWALIPFSLFRKGLHKLKRKIIPISAIVSAIYIILAIVLLYVNHNYREDSKWTFVNSRCEDCEGSFVLGMVRSLAVIQIILFAAMFFTYKDGVSPENPFGLGGAPHSVAALERVSPSEVVVARQPIPQQIKVKTLTSCQKFERLVIITLLLIPTGVVVMVYQFLLHPMFVKNNVNVVLNGLVNFACFGLGSAYAGFTLTKLKDIVLKSRGIDLPTDYLYFEDLLVDYFAVKRIHHPHEKVQAPVHEA